MKIPLVHWLPKGPLRRATIRLALRLGLGASYFTDRSVDERVRIYAQFSDSETYYRSHRALSEAFERNGTACEFRETAASKLETRVPSLPSQLRPLAAAGYGLFAATYLATTQR